MPPRASQPYFEAFWYKIKRYKNSITIRDGGGGGSPVAPSPASATAKLLLRLYSNNFLSIVIISNNTQIRWLIETVETEMDKNPFKFLS